MECINYYLVCRPDSDGKYCANPRLPFDLGMIVNFSKGLHPSKNQLTTAWPLSCTATISFYYALLIPYFSKPPIILSVAISKSTASTLIYIYIWLSYKYKNMNKWIYTNLLWTYLNELHWWLPRYRHWRYLRHWSRESRWRAY